MTSMRFCRRVPPKASEWRDAAYALQQHWLCSSFVAIMHNGWGKAYCRKCKQPHATCKGTRAICDSAYYPRSLAVILLRGMLAR